MTPIRARDVLDALYDGVEGFVNIRTLPPVEQAFITVRDADALRAFVLPRGDRNVYFGVAARVRPDGALTGCGPLTALFADLDFKTFPTETAARERLTTAPLAPSIVVQSGGGLHSYWLLKEAIDLQTDAPIAKGWLRRLAHGLDGDLASAEPAHILRLPNTYNHKYRPARPVTVETFWPERRYNASEFDDWLPDEPRETPPPRTDTGRIAAGRRNAHLTSLAGSMRRRGMTEAAILAALVTENAAQCDPALSPTEVERIARSVARYAPADTATDEGDVELTSLETLMREPEDALDWLVTDRFARGSVNLIAGRPKAGKSTLARALALSVARGERWLGHRCHPGRVVYLALEDKRSEVKRHLRAMGGKAESIRFLFGKAPRDLLAQLTALAAGDGIDLLIVDTLQRLVPVKDGNDYALVVAAFEPVLALARTHDTCIVLVHHAGKTDRGGLEAVLGSIGYTASADNVLLLNRTDKYRLVSTIQRIGPDLGETVVLMDDETGDVHLGGSRYLVDIELVAAALLESVRSAPAGILRTDLLADVEARRELKLKALKRLLDQGRIVRTGAGHRYDPHRFVLALEPDALPASPTGGPEPDARHPPPRAKSSASGPGFPISNGNPMKGSPVVTDSRNDSGVICGSRLCAGSPDVPDRCGHDESAVPVWLTEDDGPREPEASDAPFADRDAEDVARDVF